MAAALVLKSESAVASGTQSPKPSPFWRRRIVDPVVSQLTQGLTPHKIALTVAVGSSIALFPILGTTTMICLLVGIVLKLNQPIIQAVNYACTPIHFPFIFFSFRWGNKWFGNPDTHLAFRPMMRLLREHPIDFVTTYSMTALHAILVWAILIPFWAIAVYYITLPIMRGINRVRTETAATKAAATEKQPR